MEKKKDIYGEVEGDEWISMWRYKDKFLESIVGISGYQWKRLDKMGGDGRSKEKHQDKSMDKRGR